MTLGKKGPLAGFRVLDLSTVVMGPYCTQALADMGADVIKIESPDGDSIRSIPPVGAQGNGGIFLGLNRGKRSVVLDLRTPEGRAACLDLARTADVFVHSMRLSAIRKLGLDYEAVASMNRRIVYCNLLGFGRGGRYSGLAAYDDIIQAASGLVSLQEELTGKACYLPTILADKVSGVTGTYAITAALLHRERTGEGQELDVPMFETMASFVLVEHLAGFAFDPPKGERPLYARIMTASRRPFPTADGRITVLVYNDKQWGNFARLVGREELVADARFRSLADRASNVDAWNSVVAEILTTRTTAEWMDALPRVGVPAITINSTADLFSDPHLQDVGFFKSLDAPSEGALKLPAFPVEFHGSPAGFSQAGPRLGEHTEEVLSEAGFDATRISRLTNATSAPTP